MTLPEDIHVSPAQVAALRLEIDEEAILRLVAMLSASCNYPQFIGEALNVSTLCVTHGAAGSAVAVTMSKRAWEMVKDLMRKAGPVTEL